MDGLNTGGIRELGLLRKRTRRLYGLGRLRRDEYEELDGLMDALADKFKKYGDDKEEIDAARQTAEV